ncbi:MAG: rod shape-determining protein MreC [Desulfatitalea sp.]|nr:rod shape-determining protein MreC [Desulfatitalea sp.]
MAIIVGLMILITLSIIFLSISSRPAHPAQGQSRFAIAVVAPFQKAISATVRFFQDVWDRYFFLVFTAEENAQLLKEAQQTRFLRHQYEEVLQSNQRLRRLLDLKAKTTMPSIAAQVVGKDPSPWFQSMLVDKGLKEGVAVGFPVVNPEGVVGLVVEAAAHYAKVVLITDPNSAVDAIVQRNRARGIVKGGPSGFCVLHFVLRKHDLKIGDTVVASGMDGVFPKGMPIGQISKIVKQEAGIFQDVAVMPYVNFEGLEEVLIVPVQGLEKKP